MVMANKYSCQLQAYHTGLRRAVRLNESKTISVVATTEIISQENLTTTQITSTRVKTPDYNKLFNERIQAYQYDGLPLKPKGGGKLEQTRRKANLLSCRQYINIATINVRTLRTTSKQEELYYLSTTCNISIIGLVDHTVLHKEETHIEKVLGNTLITTSAWRNANNAASGGIGILLDKATISSLGEVIKWNIRIIIVHFNGNPKTSIIIHYSPCEGSDEAVYF